MICKQFAALILAWASYWNVPPRVLDAQLYRESSCNEMAVNLQSGATGLGQIMPNTVAADGFEQWELTIPTINIRLAAKRLRHDYEICHTWRGARRLYEGHKYCKEGK